MARHKIPSHYGRVVLFLLAGLLTVLGSVGAGLALTPAVHLTAPFPPLSAEEPAPPPIPPPTVPVPRPAPPATLAPTAAPPCAPAR